MTEFNVVTKASHYNNHPSGVECIRIIEHLDFCIGSAVKYLWRAGLKDGAPTLLDYQKARYYLGRSLGKEHRPVFTEVLDLIDAVVASGNSPLTDLLKALFHGADAHTHFMIYDRNIEQAIIVVDREIMRLKISQLTFID